MLKFSLKLSLSTLLFTFLLLPLGAAEPSLQDICKTWTGLDKSSKPKFLYEVQISLQPAPEEAAEPVPETTARGRGQIQQVPFAEATDRSKVKTLRVQGSLRSTPIGRSMDGSTDAKVDSIEGVYFPDMGILKFKRVGPGFFPVGDVFAVFNESATEMCLVFSGSLSKNPPLYLSAGTALADDLRALGNLNGSTVTPTQNRFSRTGGGSTAQRTTPAPPNTRTNQLEDTRAATQQIRAKYQQDRRAIQEQIAAATRARNTAQVAALREQQKQLTAEYNRQMAAARSRGQAGQQNVRQPRTTTRTSTARQQPAASQCPEHILAWVNEMEQNGGSIQTFNGYHELANLFRPTSFVPHFGKTFADMSDQDLAELGRLIQLTCANDGSSLARGGLRIPLGQLLNRPTTWGTTEIGIAGMALDVGGDWAKRMMAFLESKADVPTIETFEDETIHLLRTLWPAERDPIVAAIPYAISGAAERLIVSTIEQKVSIMEQAEPKEIYTALYGVAKIPYKQLFERIHPEERERVTQLYIDLTVDAIGKMEARFKRELAAITDFKERNAFTLDWWAWAYNPAIKFFGQHFDANPFMQWLGEQREYDWQLRKDEIFKEIDSNDSLIYARTYIPSISLYQIDKVYCPTWRDILAHQEARLVVLEREALIARVGEGPFGIDYPGAIYLNAIYRLDHGAIARENKLLSRPLEDYVSHQRDNILQQILENKMRESFEGTLTGKNFIDPLLAYFAGSYQIHYPDCMENPVRITEIKYYETVATNSFGSQVVDSFTDETNYVINGRHVDAFKALEQRPFSPGNRDFILNLFGSFVPEDIRQNADLLREAVNGLQRAMQERPCTDPVIQQLDKNLHILFNQQ